VPGVESNDVRYNGGEYSIKVVEEEDCTMIASVYDAHCPTDITHSTPAKIKNARKLGLKLDHGVPTFVLPVSAMTATAPDPLAELPLDTFSACGYPVSAATSDQRLQLWRAGS
jgi:hypothetical protein